MREMWAKIVAVLTGVLATLLAFAWVQNPRAPATAPATPPALVKAGHALYQAQGCPMCHAIAGEGNPRYPLDGVGGRRDAAALRDWMLATRPAAEALPARAARMKQTYRALAEDEIDALVAYLRLTTRWPWTRERNEDTRSPSTSDRGDG